MFPSSSYEDVPVASDSEANEHSLPEYSPVIMGTRSYGYKPRRLNNLHMLLTSTLAITSIVLLSLLLAERSDKNTTQVTPVSQSSTDSSESETTSSSTAWVPLPKPEEVIDTLVFGSCMKAYMPQPFWDTVADFEPQVTVLAGDNVYMGVMECSDERCIELQEAYDALDSHPSFQGAKQNLPMVAILDDHDYGQNDCHDTNPYKDIAKEMFFDFYDIPQDDERRTRQNEGLYTSYEWGPEGNRLQLILLDTRYSRSRFLYDADLWGYVAYNETETSKRMLSDKQWLWLEEVLQRPANVRLIVSGVQVLSEGVWGFEHWALIPSELDRLKKMLVKYCMQPEKGQQSLPVLLSGDRHIGAVYRDKINNLHEVTASSWTHTIPDGWDPDGVKCEGEHCIEKDPTRVGDWVGVNHFGVVNVDWEKRILDVLLVQAETSLGYPVKTKWRHNSDAGATLKKISLQIP